MTLDTKEDIQGEINASPTKDFFVKMLTRDIELEDAILDLLDNCVDGIQRTIGDDLSSVRPYERFWAKISFSETGFVIEDNCGGIPLDVAKRYAFRMGRPEEASDADKDVYTIGTYGIGMKRAIFKMGCSSQIISQTETDAFQVPITPEWLNSDTTWDLPLIDLDHPLEENGTKIEITHLKGEISREFEESSNSSLHNTLIGKISNHYSYILSKGFEIWVNDVKAPLTPLNLLLDSLESLTEEEFAIAPYLYQGHIDGVDIELAVGFYRPTATEEEIDEDKQGKRRSSDNAGWTIVCNDRVVVYCDKTRLTGWGEATVPSYHPQFIAISGIVHFRSKDARILPITTTKRGIDSSSEIYLFVKDFMREGLKYFTNYTNKWKKDHLEEKKMSSRAQSTNLSKIFNEMPSTAWTQVRKKTSRSDSTKESGRKYTPKLPMPESTASKSDVKRMAFLKPTREVQIVADYLFEDSDRDPSEVAEACFTKVLREAEK